MQISAFCLNEDREIVDRLDPSAKHLVECYSLEGFPDDEIHLREQVLWRRLDNLVRALIINTNPTEKLPTGEEYQPFCEESRSISLALHQLIKASRLNTLDVTLSMQDRFDGVLKGDKVGLQDFTSLPLFVDDAERLLRDLYGESDNEAINRVRDAVSWIVEEFTKYLRKDLWQEHRNAVDIDYMCGIGVPEGHGISTSDFRDGQRAVHDLELHARAVRANPEAFSKYTVEFVNELFLHWRNLNHWPSVEVQPPEELPF